jgi:hypothetical protein
MTNREKMAKTILQRVQTDTPKPKKSPAPNAATYAVIEALKTGDAERLENSLSDFIRIHNSTS